ncbi:MAG: hypothetical protein RBR77_08245 [Thauera sp.]|jgi:hypothetical protein|nr:hypothetical protein [Thauera sp.]
MKNTPFFEAIYNAIQHGIRALLSQNGVDASKVANCVHSLPRSARGLICDNGPFAI